MRRFREPVSGFTHLVGAVLAALGTIWLVTLTLDDIAKLITVLVFGLSMVLLYSASAVMHLYNGPEKTVRLLVKLDHAAIFLLIAGTYTPFCVYYLTGYWRWAMLGILWGIAVAGALFKLFFFRGGHLSTLLYILMGWTGLLAAPVILPQMGLGLVLVLLAGGLVYTAGAVIFALRRPNFHPEFGHHELWHLFVMAGSAVFFAAVLFYVVL